MFNKILIANRGEIACRVIKTARAMGIQSVAVYSDADKNALHVSMADEAVHIGAAAASDSYLLADKIIAACKSTGAEAVHPGYGFLSERAEFATALAAEHIAFIGPPVGAIKAMGDKITSKKLAAEAGVSTVPGHMGIIKDAAEAVTIARQIGYPVMIKASAGGGGKGMRVAYDDEQAEEGFERSSSEAAASFGDDRIFIEKFVEQPRHIEIQVLADSHGNCIYLGERECSIQRRNQKVIEEAPSPFLDAVTRKAMGEQSVALSQAVDYSSAGTVEFIVDKDQNFYFLEMNTRLQVEHPVTELITGIDLVEQMIRIAYGESLSISQQDVKLSGWAMESRVYAEDPYKNFLPSIGRLTRYAPPAEIKSADTGCITRNDTGVYEGGEISMFYDPMIAKLCTWSENRTMAIDAMQDALNEFAIEGIEHNLPFLSAVMSHDRFRSGNISTAFIAEEWPDGFSGVAPSEEELTQSALTALALHALTERLRASPDRRRFNTKASETNHRVVRVNAQNREFSYTVTDNTVQVSAIGSANNITSTVSIQTTWLPGETFARLRIEGLPVSYKVQAITGGYRLRRNGMDIKAQVLSAKAAELMHLMPDKQPPDTSRYLLCPMPGLVIKLNVVAGDEVQEGQALAIVEAMKMENVLRAEKPGTVLDVPVSEGDSLAVDDIILEFQA